MRTACRLATTPPCSSCAGPPWSTTPGQAEILTAQLADFQPEGRHAAVAPGTAPYGRMLPGIRGVRLTVLRVDAKFKYDDANPVEHRERVIDRLEQRGPRARRRGRGPAAAARRRAGQ